MAAHLVCNAILKLFVNSFDGLRKWFLVRISGTFFIYSILLGNKWWHLFDTSESYLTFWILNHIWYLLHILQHLYHEKYLTGSYKIDCTISINWKKPKTAYENKEVSVFQSINSASNCSSRLCTVEEEAGLDISELNQILE